MPDEDFTVSLDENVLESLAWLICGDDTTPYYRQGYQIAKFFRNAGWGDVGEVDGYRRSWTQELLLGRKDDSEALRKILLRLADPRKYLDDETAREATLTELNRILAAESYLIDYEHGRPKLLHHDPSTVRMTSQIPIELTVSLADIVSDPVFGGQLKARLDEAYRCWQTGAPTAAIIMLGSLLEGVLYDVALSRHATGPKPSDRLEQLIINAREQKWISREVAEYADVLRNHRNLVHPKKQWTQAYRPTEDAARIAWNVVVGAFNNLAELPRPDHGPESS
ncbi:hypothetical protein ACIA2T_29100 [Amycolatopsis japonica]|uniref:hypothetical protein n=1 Tax=Amycolatopsis japonica TaxID=208439 RepID=UPI0037B3CBB8